MQHCHSIDSKFFSPTYQRKKFTSNLSQINERVVVISHQEMRRLLDVCSSYENDNEIALERLSPQSRIISIRHQNITITSCVRQSGERILFESFQISPEGIDRDAMRFQGLRAILLWLAHLASISHDKPRHCAAVTRSNAPT